MALSVAEMAEIHQLSFTTPRPWGADEISQMVDAKGAIDVRRPDGFLLGRVIADEAELLTVAVHPKRRRDGVGFGLTQVFLTQAKTLGAVTAFLEVSALNAPACALYAQLGFTQAGLRKGYYGAEHDALILRHDLNGQPTAA